MENNATEKELLEQPVPEVAAAEIATPANPTDTAEKPVGFWPFLGLIVLFAIPVVGFIACIVFMFAPQSKSMKNYARAFMAWLVIRFVATVAVILTAVSILGTMFLPAINSSLGTNFGSFFELADVAADAMRGNYADVIAHLRPQLIDKMGEEAAPLLDEFSKSEYNDFFKDVMNEDYDSLLSDIQDGKYPNLQNALGDEDYQKLIAEIESCTTGQPSEFFDELRGLIPKF